MRSEPDKRHHVFMARGWRGQPVNMEPHRADAVTWSPIDKLPDRFVDHECGAARVAPGERTHP